MPAYLIEPAAAVATVPDYSSTISAVTTELNDIDTDTTSMAAQILLISASLATMAANSTTITNNSTTIAQKLTDIETYQKRLKELGETVGIRTTTPYEIFGLISIYKLMIEEAKILELDKVNDEKKAEAYRTLQYYVNQIKKVVPKDF